MVWIFTISLLLLFICLLMLNQYLRKYRFWLQQHVEVISTWGLLRRTRKVQLYQAIREIYVRLCREHKPFAVIESYFISTVIVQDQQAIKEVLTSQFENFPDRGFYVNRRDPLMVNLVRIHYDLWKPLRGKLTPAFSPAKLKYFYPTMAAVGDELVQVLTAHILNDDAVVELRDLCKRFAMDVIGTVAFGIECNSLKNPQAELKVECDKAFLQHFRPFLDQFGEKYSKFLNFINYKYHSEESINFFTNLVKEALEYREKYNVRRRDFLDLLIEFRQDREGFPLSLEMIVGQVFIFFIGGYESSSSALCQALYELSKNPEMQEKARQEVLQTMKLNDNKLTYDSLKSLKYIKQVAQETLRKYPILHSITRYSRQYCTLRSSCGQSLNIPKNTAVMVPAHGIHYNPEFYPEPEKFLPERFDDLEIAKRPPYTFLSFGDGPRSCVASNFGLMELQFALATLLSTFRFSVTETTPENIEFDRNKKFSMGIKNDIFVKVEMLKEN